MNVQARMYTLNPIISLPHVLDQSQVMYKMKNIHEEEGKGDHAKEVNEIKTVPDVTMQSPLPEYAVLEARQEKILSQLAELKKQVSTLCDFLKQTNQTESLKAVDQKHLQQPINAHLVVYANPKRPPYSLIAIQKAWPDVNIGIQSYVHSSITGEPALAHVFNTGTCGSDINFSLVWKDVESVEFVIDLKSYRLTGEVNLLRYVSRIVDTHNYEKTTCSIEPNTTDMILDLCHSLHFQENSKRAHEILTHLAATLSREKPLDHREVSIADMAAWSTIKQLGLKKVPTNLNKWFDMCEKMFK